MKVREISAAMRRSMIQRLFYWQSQFELNGDMESYKKYGRIMDRLVATGAARPTA